MTQLIVLMILLSTFNLQTQDKRKESKIIDCKITFASSDLRTVACPELGSTLFLISEWPKEWEDSFAVDDTVKMKTSDEEMIPFLSCEARYEIRKKELEKRKNEFKLPLQLPIDKDCQ